METILKIEGDRWKHGILEKYVRLPNHPMKLRLWNWLKKLLNINYVLGHTSSNLKMYLNLKDWVQYQIYFYENYEYESVKLFKELSLKSKIIFDIGAHVGQYALEAAQLDKNFEKQIFAIEANPKTFTFLLNNIQINEFKNIKPILTAISSQTGILKLGIPAYWNLGNSQITENQDEEGFHISATGLNQILAKFSIDQIDLLKIDIEGHEYIFFKNIFEDLGIFPKNIIFEYIPSSFPSAVDLCKLLEKHNYQLKNVEGRDFKGEAEVLEQNIWAIRN